MVRTEPPADAAAATPLLPRRARRLLLTAEAAVAAVLGGLAIGGAFGVVLVGLAALGGVLTVVAVVAGRSRLGTGTAPSARELLRTLHVVGTTSRSSGDVGVVGDGQGFAAGLELDLARGAALDVAALVDVLAADPARLSGVQVRVTGYLPPGAATRRAQAPVYRRVHLLLRFEPTWADDVVRSHGGGARGARSALVAAVDRAALRLRTAGLVNRVVDATAMSALLAEDTAQQAVRRTLAADLVDEADLRRVLDLLRSVGPQRSVVSVCVDFAGGDQWYSRAFVQLAGVSAAEVDAAADVLVADDAVDGIAPAGSIAAVLPLGGGPGDLTAYLTLART